MSSVQDPEAAGISLQALQTSTLVSPKLLDSIKKADKDNNGIISADELVTVIQAQQQATESSKTLRKIILALAILLVLNVAATAGLTYGIVYLTRDSSINDENVIVSKANGGAVSSANVVYSEDLAKLYKITDPVELAGIEHLILPEGDSGYRLFQVTGMELQPNVSVTLNTTMNGGASIVIDESGISEVVPGTGAAGAGRRLLAIQNGQVVINGQVITSRIPKPTSTPKVVGTVAPIDKSSIPQGKSAQVQIQI